MSLTHLHVVGGFLGSGKTTAIIQACKRLQAQGKRTGVITNDQGKYLVDTAFFRLGAIPAVEVTGGCFCCNYDDLNSHLEGLVAAGPGRPDAIFAESVGSCADLIATVVKPLLSLGTAAIRPRSFSVFVDIRLLRLLLRGEELPFSENVNYIFEKQIEEAGILVINKQDLLRPEKAVEVADLARQRYPEKDILLQNSLESDGVLAWLERLEMGKLYFPAPSLEIDYQKYGSGEADLAWLDQEFHWTGLGLRSALLRWLEGLLAALESDHQPVGHLKLILSGEAVDAKLSFTTPMEQNWHVQVPQELGEKLNILLNARVMISAERLQALVSRTLAESLQGTSITVQAEPAQAFHPGFPRPTHRFA